MAEHADRIPDEDHALALAVAVPNDLVAAVALCRDVLNHVDRRRTDEPMPLEDAWSLVEALADLSADVAAVLRSARGQVAEAMADYRVPLGDGRVLVRRATWRTSWHSEDVIRDLHHAADGDPDQFASLLIEGGGLLNASASWRVGVLRDAGLEVDDYRERSQTGWRPEAEPDV